MEYEVDPLFGAIIGAVAADGPISGRMLRVIDECERQRPHPDWALMRKIDFLADEARLGSWLPRVFAEADPSKSFQGLWFGLNNPGRWGTVTADIYVGAAEAYSPESIEWATECSFLPENGYLRSKVLRAIYKLSYERKAGLENDAEYPMVLAYGAMLARSAVEATALKGVLRDLRGAACGFDSGDSLTLGTFIDSRFQLEVAIAR